MAITTMLISLLLALVPLVGGIILEIFLSSRQNKWLGLILPAITFLFSIFILLQLIVPPDEKQIVFIFASTFIVSNIPTLILLAVYFACRQRFKRRAQIEKMSVQDL